MKGTAHLAIGISIGAVTAAQFSASINETAILVAVAGFSALSADLDGMSMLSGKLSKLSKILRNLILWVGIALISIVAYLFFVQDRFYMEFTIIAAAVFLLSLVTKSGVIRNGLLSLIGAGLIYAGLLLNLVWLMGLGLFVAWAPWLKHRGMTHTIWAVLLWGAIGMGLENHLQFDGITNASVIGYFSHLVADTLTPSGVKWFYPIYKKSIKLPLLK